MKRLTILLAALAALAAIPATAMAKQEGLWVNHPVQLQADTYPATMSGSAPSVTLLSTPEGPKVTCESVEYKGEKLNAPVESFSLAPSYRSCTLNGGKATVVTTGCRYKYSSLTYLSGEEYSAAAAIDCDAGHAIAITFEEEGVNCTVKLPSQTLAGGKGTSFTSHKSSPSNMTATMAASNVAYTAEGAEEGFGCLLLGIPTGSHSDGSMTGQGTIWYMYIGGGPKVEAGGYPAELVGERFHLGSLYGPIKFFSNLEGGGVSCGKAAYSGSLSAPSTSLSLGASYSECSVENTSIAVNMNGCSYVWSKFAPIAEGRVTSAAEIVCPKGQAVELNLAEGFCVITMPSQTLTLEKPSELDAMTVGEEKVVGGAMVASGVEYTAENLCQVIGLENGTGNTGTITQYMLLRGYYS